MFNKPLHFRIARLLFFLHFLGLDLNIGTIAFGAESVRAVILRAQPIGILIA